MQEEGTLCRFELSLVQGLTGLLPVFMTDEDIYTQLPTVIVGTLDKLATIGFRSAFRTLIGKSDDDGAFAVFPYRISTLFHDFVRVPVSKEIYDIDGGAF